MRRMGSNRLAPHRILVLASLGSLAVVGACSASTEHDADAGAGASSGSNGAGGQGSQASVGAGGEDGSTTGFDPSTGAGMGGSDGSGGCGGGSANNECETDADCNDNDATTTDACIIINPGSEFPVGSCVHVPCDGGPDCTSQPVDPTCTDPNAPPVYPPFVPINPPSVPASCSNGFELTDAAGAPNYVIHSVKPTGSQGLTINLDFATYTAPDGLLITGVDGCGKPYVLFDSCRLKTADQPWSAYGNGMERPDDIALRQFNLTLLPGTTELTFDFSRVSTPMYVRVLGLCDFDLPAITGVKWSAFVP